MILNIALLFTREARAQKKSTHHIIYDKMTKKVHCLPVPGLVSIIHGFRIFRIQDLGK